MKYPQAITLCGFGGQGIILAANILGTTAVTKVDLFAVQTQSYGSEARGGECQAELILDTKSINEMVAEKKTILIAMFQSNYDKFVKALDKDGVQIIDPDLVKKLDTSIKHTFKVPATQIAMDLGSRMVANMVMLGFFSECFDIVTREQLEEVIREKVDPRFIEMNLKGISAGVKYAKENNFYFKD